MNGCKFAVGVCNYEIYQFTGDGWILLFHNPKIDGEALMNFLVEISRAHNKFRKKLIDIHLHALPESTGLTFGLDMGSLQKFILGGETRYVGHALNVACKLQDAKALKKLILQILAKREKTLFLKTCWLKFI